MKNIHCLFSGILFLLFPCFAGAQQLYFPPANNFEWEKVSPESLNWCVEKTDSLYNFLESRNTKAFIVLKDGKIAMEKYFGTFTSDSLWYWASAGKTLTSMLVGIAQEEGYLSIDSAVSKYIGQGWTTCPPEKEALIKIKNQLSMTSGLNDTDVDPDCTLPSCLFYKADAGSRWAYHNAPYTLLDQVIGNATGIDFSTYFYTRIRNKTGMNGLWFTLDYNNLYFSTARSMAKYGLLLQAKGNWDGQPVINDTSYYNAMVNSSQDMNVSYGYLTWLNGKETYMLPQSQFIFPGYLCPDAPEDMYAAMGKNGQLINVVPSKGLVMIRMGDAPDNQYELANYFNNQIWQLLNEVICNSNSINEEVKSVIAFDIFPNPASTLLQIIPDFPSQIYSVSLFDMSGYIKFQSANARIIDVSALPSGNYILVLSVDGIRKKQIISIVR
jgi:CubicO group peptidase (beta-lactamase class C family)